MGDKPILFSAPMVRALLAGTKSQTRRFLDAWTEEPPAYTRAGIVIALDENEREYRWPRTRAVGDRLYVRENFALCPTSAWALPKTVSPDPDMAAYYQADFDRSGCPHWKPSIHMPRWASRLTLTVTDVRVERLQDISETDALAEGIVELLPGRFAVEGLSVAKIWGPTAVTAYRQLWTLINGAGSWEANPWVAAYTLTVALGNIDQIARAA